MRTILREKRVPVFPECEVCDGRDEQLLAVKVALSDTRQRLVSELSGRVADRRLLQVRAALSDLRARVLADLELSAYQAVTNQPNTAQAPARSTLDRLRFVLGIVKRR